MTKSEAKFQDTSYMFMIGDDIMYVDSPAYVLMFDKTIKQVDKKTSKVIMEMIYGPEEQGESFENSQEE